jgi:hypothetical protein
MKPEKQPDPESGDETKPEPTPALEEPIPFPKYKATDPSVSPDIAPEGHPNTVEGVSASDNTPKPKTGVFGRIKPRRREELGAVVTQEIPLRLPNDYHQLYPIDTEDGEGVVYTVKITLPAEKEEKTYIVLTSIVEEARERAENDDPTFAILTPVELHLGGAARAFEMHPWVERSGRFGFWPIVVGMEDNPRSMAPYQAKLADINDHQGKWARRTGGITTSAPPNTVWSAPKWPEELLNGGLDALILRAYRGRVIESLDSTEAKWLAGLISI